ncbi:type IV pilus assembly protein PilV [Povalibacter uvarum]|uniref:Type IV pilus assembly protein PilV n=1 Tax=Povalibacter uvarum TaxID=732238 RepID=A0A841HFE9_9GAMM|nr:type IV pilus modification protein PilV [Povalibacter uvarum]MBB6091841.1 type IV pilus assembly protein PilV [Povalibacter uvarum]
MLAHAKVTTRRRQTGATLVEVLVTLVSTAVGLLGIAALQFVGLRSNQEAYHRLQASSLASSMLDCIRANRTGFLNDEYSAITFNGTQANGERATADLLAWQSEIDRILPGGPDAAAGAVERTQGTNVITVSVRWGPRTGNAAAGPGVLTLRAEL